MRKMGWREKDEEDEEDEDDGEGDRRQGRKRGKWKSEHEIYPL